MGPRRVIAYVVLVACLGVYYCAAGTLPGLGIWLDAALVSLLLIPGVLALVTLVLPLRHARGLGPVALALGVLTVVLEVAGLDVLANFAKLAAVTAMGFWFVGYFERLSWVVLVAGIIPVVDALSVWRGPTREIVSDRPAVFDALSVAFPVPDEGSFQLGLPDVLFFAVFLAAAARWALRVGVTWLAMTASFGVTLALALWLDPFGLGGLPALPLLSLGFLAANADLLWRELRGRPELAA